MVVSDWCGDIPSPSTVKVGPIRHKRAGRVPFCQSAQPALLFQMQETGMPVTNQCRCVWSREFKTILELYLLSYSFDVPSTAGWSTLNPPLSGRPRYGHVPLPGSESSGLFAESAQNGDGSSSTKTKASSPYLGDEIGDCACSWEGKFSKSCWWEFRSCKVYHRWHLEKSQEDVWLLFRESPAFAKGIVSFAMPNLSLLEMVLPEALDGSSCRRNLEHPATRRNPVC